MPCTLSAPCCGVLRRYDEETLACGNGHHFRLTPVPVFVPLYVSPRKIKREGKGFRYGKRAAASSNIRIPKRQTDTARW